MRHITKTLSALLLLAVFFLPSETRADDMIIASGYLSSRISGGTFSLSALDFTINGTGAGTALIGPVSCFPCVAGDSINLTSRFSGSDIGPGPATVAGTNYERLFYDGQLVLEGRTVLAPFDNSPLVSLTAPFTFNGSLSGCTQSQISGCQGDLIFSTTMVGQGIATLQLTSFFDSASSRRFYQFQNISYNFQNSAPIPEPTTLLLLGTGLAGAAVRYRQSRSKPNR